MFAKDRTFIGLNFVFCVSKNRNILLSALIVGKGMSTSQKQAVTANLFTRAK